jgi:hypothetical protein
MRNSILKSLLLSGFIWAMAVSQVNAGYVVRLIYENITGSAVSNLTSNPIFPTDFTSQENIGNTLDTNGMYVFESPSYAYGDNYGSWTRGYFEAPTNGAYTFWLATDDASELWLSTDTTVGNKKLIAQVNDGTGVGYSGIRQWDKYPSQKSTNAINLVKGQKYYFEVLHKEGGGTDFIAVGWTLPDGTLQRPLPGYCLFPYLASDTPFAIPQGQGPQPVSVEESRQALFFVDVASPSPNVTFQWYKGIVAIPEATLSWYVIDKTVLGDAADYKVKVTYLGQPIYSDPATLTVYQDTTPPELVSASSQGNPTQVQVVFSEPVTAASAQNIANYSLSSGTIQSATLQADGLTVILKMASLLTPDRAYTLTINNIADLAGQPNLIAAGSNLKFLITDGMISYRLYYSIVATDLATLRTWSTNTSVAATYVNNLFNEERLITTTSYQWSLLPLRDNFAAQIIGYVTAPEDGNYKFAIASDDHSILYLGTSDLRSSKREICNYNGSTGQWNLGAQLANQQSAFITLQAGKRYYFEAVSRDGTGSDGMTIAWQTPSDTAAGLALPTANASVAADTQPFLIPARYLSTFVTFGVVTLKTNLPAAISAAESTRPVLQVTADGSLPYAYQWFKNGVPITNATAASYTLPFLRPADNNGIFQVVVTNNFSSVTSVVATLTVTSDTTKPSVASVGSLFKQKVEVRFTEPVTPATATAMANYTLLSSAGTPVAVNSVVVDPSDPAHVTLQTAAMPETDLMRLVVQNLADLSPAANAMAPQTNVFRANNFDAVERIGNSQAYSAAAVGDQILMTAGGSDIYGTSDQCAFAYKPVTGNFDYKVQGISLPAVNSWCKMGPMARASTAAGSRNVFNPFTPVTPGQNTYSAQVRDLTAGTSTSSNDAGTPLNISVQGGVPARPTILPYPSWLRLQRIGNTIYYYYGTNGTNWTYWTSYDSTTSGEGALPATLLVGLALTSHDTARTVDGVMASFTAINDGALNFTLQPTNTTVVEGGTAVFRSSAGGSTPYFYQWLKNGGAITDATNATLNLTRVSFADNGAQIACGVSNPYGESVTTTNALLTVVKDEIRPTVRYYVMPKINLNSTEVKLLYSEWVDAASAQTIANYQITTSPGGAPLAISSIALDVDERTVIITTAAQTPGTLYKVVVNSVLDLACCPPNSIAPNSTDYFFYSGSSGNLAQRADGYIIMEAENAQENNAGSDGDTWQLRTTSSGYSGQGYMVVPNGSGGGGTAGTAPNLYGTGAKLVYNIIFNRVGRHIIWIRGWNENLADPGSDDSVHIGFSEDGVNDYMVAMNGTANDSTDVGWSGSTWSWRSDRYSGTDPLTFTNATTGLHRFVIWQREDGTLIDKIVIEAGNRAAGNTAAPAPATANGGIGEPETWDFIVPPPAAPTIVISSPTNGQVFAGNGSIPITATVTGPVVLVEFFLGTNLLGTATAEPFTFNWPNVPEGIYTVTARATDGLGYQATSTAVRFVVDSTKPVMQAVASSFDGSLIGVLFREPTAGLDPVSATNTANYQINNGAIAISSARLEPDNATVTLVPATPVSGQFTVKAQNVADLGFGPNVMDLTTLTGNVAASGFSALDMGLPDTNNPALFRDPVMPGYTLAINATDYYFAAGGSDIQNAADECQFLYQEKTGDFNVYGRVESLTRPSDWSKVCFMVRENLNAGSRNVVILTAPTNGQNVIDFQWRDAADGTSASLATTLRVIPTPIPNCWLRLQRSGDLYYGYWGTNGTDWTLLSTYSNAVATPYPAKTYVGVAVTSHNNGTNLTNTVRAVVRNLTGFGAIVTPPTAPTMTFGLQGSTLTLGWPKEAIGFKLQSSLVLPATAWQDVAGSDATNSVTLTIGAGNQYYRLMK